jgi:hypothetical protein
MGIPIIIPSADRAGHVLTRIEGAILHVPETQVPAYARRHADMEIHGDPPYRNLAEKRQAIYARYGDHFQVDDDIVHVSRQSIPGNPRNAHLTPAEVRDLIDVAYLAAKDAGAYLFGFNRSPNPKHYIAHKPIMLVGYINASAFGLRRSPHLFFTPHTTAAESHWINLLNAYYHRYIWADMRYHFAQKPHSTFFRAGGQAARRTLDSERRDTLFLRRMFGDAVRIKKGRATDAVAIHQYQRTIRIPL